MVGSFAPSRSSARPEVQVCALCATPARYKCPACAIPTCSLPCSRRHKEDIGCTGERDKVMYVPMNAYGWGTMMRDYCYLEEVGRKVSEWGGEIVRGRYTENTGASKVARARKSSSGRKPNGRKSKRDVLKAHLETLEIDVEFLPAGMERRDANQSTFHQKSRSSLLTIELVFYRPITLVCTSFSPPSSYRILSHRNSLSATLLTILQHQVSLTLSKSQRQDESVPDWLPSLVTPHPEVPECFIPPHCYIRANVEFPHVPNTLYYHKLEPTQSLSELLRRTSFIEFPTIHVFDPEASSFCGAVIDKSGSIVRVLGDNQMNVARAAKRRKLNETVGLKAVLSLICGYGSEGSSHSEKETASAGLAALEPYSESEDDVAPTNAEEEENQSLNFDDDDDVSAKGNQLDPARLLEFVEHAQSTADEDEPDWGDEWNVNAEERT